MALLTNQLVRRSGLNPAFTAPAAGGDTFVPSNRTYLYVKVGATATTITVPVPAGRGVTYSDISVGTLSIGPVTGQDRIIGPFPADVFADPTTGLATVQTSQQANVTLAAFDLAPA